MKIKTKRGARRIRNQRVIDGRFVVTDYDRCSYITAGKLYRLVGICEVVIDRGRVNYLRIVNHPCAHLDDIGTWYHPIR